MLPLLLLLPLALAADVQTLVLHASFGNLAPEAVEATLQRNDRRDTLTLVDNGTDLRDARGDRVYTGSISGDPVQYLPLTLTVTLEGQRQDVYNGLVRVGLERTVELAFEVTTGEGGQLMGVRRASASPGRMSHATEAIPLMAAGFWAVFLLVYGAVVVRMRPSA